MHACMYVCMNVFIVHIVVYVWMFMCVFMDVYAYAFVRVDVYINPLDPNPAISAHAVFPQSDYIRPEKRPFFQNFPHSSN